VSEEKEKQKRVVVVEANFPMPTWNRILGMTRFQRMKLRHLIHRLTSMYTISENDCVTLMAFPSKQPLTDSLLAEYFQTIRPSSLNRSKLLSAKARLKKQSSDLKKSNVRKKRKS
jgi:hypothetical protein